MKDMKKIVIALAGLVIMAACNPSHENGGESGTVNDGFEGAGDANGGLAGDTAQHFNPSVDTAIGDNRVDTEKRDTSKYHVGKDPD
jgi:hypothetical protein